MIVGHRVVGQQSRTRRIRICHKEIGRNPIRRVLTCSPIGIAKGQRGGDGTNAVGAELAYESRIRETVSSRCSRKESGKTGQRSGSRRRQYVSEVIRSTDSGVD